MLKYINLVLLITVISAINSHAQCDCPGSVPFEMVIVSGPINNGRLMPDAENKWIAASYSLAEGDKLYSGTEKQPNTYGRSFDRSGVVISAGYALTSRMTLGADYRFNRVKIKDIYTNKKFNTQQISLNWKYNMLSVFEDDEFLAELALNIPISGGIDSADVSRVSGAELSTNYAIMPALTYNYMINERLNLIGTLAYSANLKLWADGTRMGNTAFARLMLRFNNLGGFYPSLALIATKSAKDKVRGTEVDNSGSTIASAQFGVGYMLAKYRTSLNLAGSLPVYRKVDGGQILPEKTIEFSISVGI